MEGLGRRRKGEEVRTLTAEALVTAFAPPLRGASRQSAVPPSNALPSAPPAAPRTGLQPLPLTDPSKARPDPVPVGREDPASAASAPFPPTDPGAPTFLATCQLLARPTHLSQVSQIFYHLLFLAHHTVPHFPKTD